MAKESIFAEIEPALRSRRFAIYRHRSQRLMIATDGGGIAIRAAAQKKTGKALSMPR
jgi:DNA recombination-dependent growth factor C